MAVRSCCRVIVIHNCSYLFKWKFTYITTAYKQEKSKKGKFMDPFHYRGP